MTRFIVLIFALFAFLAMGCAKNPVAPSKADTSTKFHIGDSDGGVLNKVQYYEPIVGEPCRGTCPDFGPTG